MIRRFLLIGVVLGVALLFTVDTADAGRLGGAYRGPYGEDVTKTEEETNTNVGEEKASDAPSTDSGQNNDTGGGNSGDSGGVTAGGDSGGDSGGDGGATGGDGGASTGDGDSGDSGDGGAAAPPPTDSGGEGSEPGGGGSNPPAAPPTGGTGGISPSGGPGTGPGAKGKTAVIDQQAFWTFWFEHNKEWILAELLKAKATRSSVAPGSGGWYFSGAVASRSLTPVTEKQKLEKILPVLQEQITHKHSWVRDAAVLAMGKLGTEKVLPYLIARVENDPDPQVVEDALLALGLTGEKKALNHLLKVLKEKPAQGNRKAFAALGLALLGNDAAVSVLLEQYKAAVNARNQDELASVLAIAIGRFRLDTVVPDFSRAIKMQKRPLLKVHVCQALGQIGGDSSRDLLLRALGDRKKEVQGAAVLALSRFPDAKVVAKLLKEGLGSGDNQVKAYACVALGRIGRDLPDSDLKLKKSIAKALKEAAVKPATNIYAAMYANLGLGIMGNDSAREFILLCLGKNRTKNRDENNSAMAMSAGLLEMTAAVPSLRDISKGGVDQDFQGYACFSLAVMGDGPSKEAILKAMKRNARRKDVLRSGCWALGLLGDEADLTSLIEYLKLEQDSMKEVRGAAAIAIGLIGDESAVDPLIEIASNDPVGSNRAFALVALGCLIDKDPVPRIPQLFENVHYRVRCDVVKDAMLNL